MNQDLLESFRRRFHPDHVPAGTFMDENDVILFVHIPKSAGMSVGAAMQEVFDAFHSVDWREPGKSFVKKTRTACYDRTRRPMRQIIMGHYGAGQIAFWRNNRLPIKAASMIRDPLARFVSQYNYNISAKHPARTAFMNRCPTMLDFARSLDYDYQLTTMIGPFYSFDDALEKLIADYCFLGVVEHMAGSLKHFAQSQGLIGVREYQINKAASKQDQVEVDDAVRNVVLEKSINDVRLYGLLESFYRESDEGVANG